MAQMNNFLEGEAVIPDGQNVVHIARGDYNRDKNSASAQAQPNAHNIEHRTRSQLGHTTNYL